jgi:hypothetical protein
MEALAEIHLCGADAPPDRREVAVYKLAEGGNGTVHARDHPVRGALVDCYVLGSWKDLWDYLGGGRAWENVSISYILSPLFD